MTEIDAEIIRAILTRQFKATFFNIGLMDDCLKVSNTIPDPGIYTKLEALHCVYYSEMSSTLRRWLFDTCIGLFTGNGFNIKVLNPSQPFPPEPALSVNLEGEWVKKFIDAK